MAHDLKVPDPARFPDGKPKIVTPVRFTRFRGGGFSAVRDRPVTHGEPPLDDHGFAATADLAGRGPVVGFGAAPGRENKFTVQVVRDFISTKAKLFPVVDDSSVVTVVSPPSGESIPHANASNTPYDVDHDAIVLAGVGLSPGAQRATVLRLHYDRPDGPVVAEMNVVIYGVTPILVRLHALAINMNLHGVLTRGLAPPVAAADLRRLFDAVNVIYEQVGIELRFAETDARGDPVVHPIDNGALANYYARPNCVSQFSEQLHILTLDGDAQHLNAYIVPRFCGTFSGRLGFGFSRENAVDRRADLAAGRLNAVLPPPQPGLIFVSPGEAHGVSIETVEASRLLLVHAIAHELGHCLGLSHYRGGETSSPEDAQSPQAGPPPPTAISHVRHDLWAHTNLMHNNANLHEEGRYPFNNDPRFYSSTVRAQIGYGISSVPVGLDRTRIIRAGQAFAIRDRPSPPEAGAQPSRGQGNQAKILRDATRDQTYRRF